MHTFQALAIGVSLIAMDTACNSTSGPHGSAVGVVKGTVTSTHGDTIANAHVVVTPAGGTPSAASVTSTSGTYSVSSVPVGAGHGTVTVTSLPSDCLPTDSVPYANLASGKSDTVNVQVPCAFSTKGQVLWINDQSGALSGLSASQLAATGTVVPTGITTGGYSYAVAFDAQGNLWVGASTSGIVPATTYLYEYATAQLPAGGTNLHPAVAITLPALGGYFNQTGYQPMGMAFDKKTLWVNSEDSNLLYGFAASQLTATGSPVPAYTVTPCSPCGLDGLAFDLDGNVWMGVEEPAPHVNEIVAISAAQLSAGGVVQPVDSIALDYGALSTGITTANHLAFDSSGDLWVTGDNSTVITFTHAQLATLSASTLTLKPNNTATVPGQPSALAFDGIDNLWVATETNVPNPATQLLRFPATAVRADGALAPDITMSLGRDNLSDYLSDAFGMAFAPGNGLPLNGSRVTRQH